MGITLAKIANNVAPIAFSYDGDQINLEYYPGHVTEKVFAQLQAFSSMNGDNIMDQFAAFNATLTDLIKSWDVYEDEAETIMFPLTPDRFAELPFPFRVACMRAILGDIRPNSVAPQK